MFKKLIALTALAFVMLFTMATPTFAATSGCNNPQSVDCQVAKALGNGVEYSLAKDTAAGFSYDILVKIDGQSNKIWLKERPKVDDVSVQMQEDGTLDIYGIGSGDSNQWNNLFNKYRTVIVGVSGIGAITMLFYFIINFMKLGASAGNPSGRQQAITGILVTGIATALLGAVSIIAGFFYNSI